MKNSRIEITINYDNIQELRGAFEYIVTKLKLSTKFPELSEKIKDPFIGDFSNVNFKKMAKGESDYIKEPERVEINENGQRCFIYKSRM